MLIRENMPAADYHAVEAINASSIKQGRISMRHMDYTMNSESKPTAAMQFGTLVHTAVLEPEKLDKSIAVWEGRKAGKAWQEYKEDHAQVQIVSKWELEQLERIRENVQAHDYAFELLNGARKELSLFWDTKEYGEAKCRIDALQGESVIDIKTTSEIKSDRLGYLAGKYGYHIQGGWYCEGANHCETFNPEFIIIWVENKAPFDVHVSRMDDECLRLGKKEAIEIAERYHKSSKYFGVDTGFNRDLIIPDYFLLKESDDE